jgi:Recombination endonuclease VII
MNNRQSHLKRNYELTEDEYHAQAASQGFLCEICREANPERNGESENLSVDHDHVTGANRGLLCNRCNKALGFLRDSQELTIRVFFYLRKYQGSQIPWVENNPQTRVLRDAAFERSLLMPADPSGKVPEEEILPVEFARAAILSPTEQVEAPRSEFD